MTRSTPRSAYDPIARAYDRYWALDAAKASLPALERLLLPHLPAGARILDLCCGTGRLARILTDRGYRVTGVDCSPGTVRLARENAPLADFILCDARLVQSLQQFDAVVSTSNSISHFTDRGDLAAVFRNAYAALGDGCRFFFDAQMEAGYMAHWPGESVISDDDMVCIARSSYARRSKTGRMEVTVFALREGSWQRSDATLRLRAYTESELVSGLKAAGFLDVLTRDARRGLEPRGVLHRAAFTGKKLHADAPRNGPS